MAGGILDSDELEAIQAAMGRNKPDADNPLVHAPSIEPIALIAQEKAGERARPDALKIARRWLPMIRAQMRRSLGLELELDVTGAEVVQSRTVRDEIARTWNRVVRTPESGSFLLSVGGPIVERVAGLLLGGEPAEGIPDRPPSPASCGIFTRAGMQIFNALETAWRRERDEAVKLVRELGPAAELRRKLFEQEELLALILDVKSPTEGKIKIFADPSTLVPPPTDTPTTPVPRHIVDRAIGQVPVTLTVHLGQARLSMNAMAQLKPGDLIELDHTSEDLLPVFCEGIPKALARPLIADGALAVEIVTSQLVKGD